MTKKHGQHSNNDNAPYSLFSSLDSIDDLQPLIKNAQAYISNTANKSTITQQLNDLFDNIQQVQEQPFISIQLQRIFKAEKLDSNITNDYELFKNILVDYPVLVSHSIESLDPHYKLNTFNSAISNYQKWLIDLLFIIYYFDSDTKKITKDILENFLIAIYQIYSAQLTTKISLRKEPQVNSEILMVIPRNRILKVHTNPINKYWLKVIFDDNHQEIEGFIQSIYLKKI